MMKLESLFGVCAIVAVLSFMGCDSSYEAKNDQPDEEDRDNRRWFVD